MCLHHCADRNKIPFSLTLMTRQKSCQRQARLFRLHVFLIAYQEADAVSVIYTRFLLTTIKVISWYHECSGAPPLQTEWYPGFRAGWTLHQVHVPCVRAQRSQQWWQGGVVVQ
jgi:hypothetical protein